MSFLLHTPKKLVAKPIHAERPTTVYIVLLSVAIFLGIILVTNMVYFDGEFDERDTWMQRENHRVLTA